MAKQLDPQLPAAHACLGNLAVASGNYVEAASEFSVVLQHEPTSDAAYKGLANAYEHMGKLREAESTYKQAISVRPHYWATYNWLGAFYYNQARVHEASEMFCQVVALAPDSIRGYSNLAASLMDEGLYDEALRAAQRSIEIQPSDYAYSNLASAYFFEQRYDDAILAFEKATTFPSPRSTAPCGSLPKILPSCSTPPSSTSNSTIATTLFACSPNVVSTVFPKPKSATTRISKLFTPTPNSNSYYGPNE